VSVLLFLLFLVLFYHTPPPLSPPLFHSFPPNPRADVVTIRDLYGYLVSAALAFKHSIWQRDHASRIMLEASIARTHAATIPQYEVRLERASLLAAYRFAFRSAETTLRTFENLLAIFLAHCMVDRELFMDSPESLDRMEAQLEDPLRASNFSQSIMRRLRILQMQSASWSSTGV
jgi:hypothetical protein